MAKKSRKKTSRKKTKKASSKKARSSRKTSSAKSGGSGRKKSSTKRTTKGRSDESDSASESTRREPSLKGRKTGRYATAESMAKAQRDISISEFFAKNRHLLGFDNPRKALLTTVKEAVDNALDACEEAGVLPVVGIAIEQLDETHFKVCITDNGPGIVRKQIPSIFARLLYGSKFHRLRMSRGQQGIGISAAGMYGLLTTGRPVKITSRTSSRSKAHHYELQIDTQKNRPVIIRDEPVDWDVDHGTCVEIELEARYLRGRQSVDDYLEQTAIANPHVTLIYNAPDGREERYDASVKELPAIPREVRPHPYGVELGVLIKMMQDTRAKSVQQFLSSSFSRVSPRVAKEIIEKSGIRKNARVKSVNGDGAKALYRAIQDTKILAPATDCVVPIGSEELQRGLEHVVPAAFYTATTRRPAVYRGNPFIIEAGLAYGRPEKTEGGNGDGQKTSAPGDEKSADDDGTPLAKIIRFANRVPLLYQQSSCAIYKSVLGMNWRSYGIPQSRGALPAGPLTVVVHMASVWVPFTSESKEAIASYPEISKEIRLALQDCGRKLGRHVRKTVRMRQELKKRSYIEKYIPAIGEALRDILDLKERQVDKTCEQLKGVLERSRKM
ncbi:MAG: DNA topoisomerase VI subunit B [Phycisphaerae bacterium]